MPYDHPELKPCPFCGGPGSTSISGTIRHKYGRPPISHWHRLVMTGCFECRIYRSDKVPEESQTSRNVEQVQKTLIEQSVLWNWRND